MSAPDLLIIDDMGTEMGTAFTVSALYNLINNRLMAKRPMIINTNLLPETAQREILACRGLPPARRVSAAAVLRR